MTRVCCIGSSHIGALRGGWHLVGPQAPGVSVTFFGAPNLRVAESLQYLTLEGRRIVSTDADVTKYFRLTSRGLDHIDLDAYDAFIVMGGVGLTKLFDLYTFYRTDEQVHSDAYVLIGSDCLLEALAGIFRTTYAYRLTVALVQLTGRPVFLVPDPRPSDALLAATGSDNAAWDFYIKLIQQLSSNGDHVSLARYYEAALAAVQLKGVAFIDVPSEMVVDHLFTPHRFCRDSYWLQGQGYEKSPQDDFFHMNQDFGARVLTDILSRLPVI